MILFIALSSWNGKPGDWSTTDLDQIPRCCPHCGQESILGHGKRPRQAHDESHAWIWVRRGLCKLCRGTFTFLPIVCVPHSSYSLLYWLAVLRRYGQRDRPAAEAPALQDAERAVELSTIGRWRRRWEECRSQFLLLPTQLAWECENLCRKLLTRQSCGEVASG